MIRTHSIDFDRLLLYWALISKQPPEVAFKISFKEKNLNLYSRGTHFTGSQVTVQFELLSEGEDHL